MIILTLFPKGINTVYICTILFSGLDGHGLLLRNLLDVLLPSVCDIFRRGSSKHSTLQQGGRGVGEGSKTPTLPMLSSLKILASTSSLLGYCCCSCCQCCWRSLLNIATFILKKGKGRWTPISHMSLSSKSFFFFLAAGPSLLLLLVLLELSFLTEFWSV